MSETALTMMTGMLGTACLISRHTSRPDIAGKRRSSTTAEGGVARAAFNPEAPSKVVSMAYPSGSNSRRSALCTRWSSSTISIRSMDSYICAPRCGPLAPVISVLISSPHLQTSYRGTCLAVTLEMPQAGARIHKLPGRGGGTVLCTLIEGNSTVHAGTMDNARQHGRAHRQQHGGRHRQQDQGTCDWSPCALLQQRRPQRRDGISRRDQHRHVPQAGRQAADRKSHPGEQPSSDPEQP